MRRTAVLSLCYPQHKRARSPLWHRQPFNFDKCSRTRSNRCYRISQDSLQLELRQHLVHSEATANIERCSARCSSNENSRDGFRHSTNFDQSCSSHFLEFRLLPSPPFFTSTFTLHSTPPQTRPLQNSTQPTCSVQSSLLFALRSPLVELSPRPRSPASPPSIRSSKPLRRQTR